MCGIVGYIGNKQATPILLEGLKRLEYRGYDSAGIAVKNSHEIEVLKKEGKLAELENIVLADSPSGTAGIGHTRWATHGRPSDNNSHPHYDQKRDFVVVHNGIIENFQEIKDELEARGYLFESDTDTEVIAHLLDFYYQGNLRETVIKVTEQLEGSYALAILSRRESDKLIAVRKDSPLIVGKSEGENFIASDIPAFLNYTNQFYVLDDGEMAEITQDTIKLFNYRGEEVSKDVFVVDWDPEMAEKNGFDHFMLKEIHEQPDALRRVLNNRISSTGLNLSEIDLPQSINKIQLIACGTASYSCQMGKYIIEELARIDVNVDLGSEFRYRDPIIDDNTLVIVVSQSGETADTLAGLRLAKKKGAKVLAITNVTGSTIAREADEVLYLKAGPEIAVASTKAYLNMVAVFYLLAINFAGQRSTISEELKTELIDDVLRLPELAARVIRENEELIAEKAKGLKNCRSAFFIGRNTDFPLVLEGALKMKEIAYIQAEAYPAGELKHGTLALIEDDVPVIAVATREKIYEKIISNIKEVKSRGAKVTALTFAGNREIEKAADNVIYIPALNSLLSGVLAIIPLQLLAYYTALERGCDIDQPRNLAKSVTVE